MSRQNDRVTRLRRDREERTQDRRLVQAVQHERDAEDIAEGRDHRQPPRYRGRIFEYASTEGLVPSPFPPYRWDPQEGLTEEFVAFRQYAGPTIITHPEYYCVNCRWRYNANDGGLCGPCKGQIEGIPRPKRRSRVGPKPTQASLPEGLPP